MRAKSANWFEVKIRYDKDLGDGNIKPVTEQYVLDADSFSDAEECITEEMATHISGDYKIKDIKPAVYREIFFSDMGNDDCWFKAKLQFITFDEKTSKEKRSNVNYLVQAHALPQAVNYIGEVMGNTMIDYVIASISDTKIQDVFEKKATFGNAETTDAKPEYEEGVNQ